MKRLTELHRRLTRPVPLGCLDWMLLWILVPAGWGFGLAGWVRARLYRWGVLSAFQPGVPVISVGNLAVGGTGKTPMVDHIVKTLLAMGKRVAVVSRGYAGRAVSNVGVVSSGAGPLLSPEVCGDEPFLLARRNPGVPVLTSRRRAAGVGEAVERFGAEIVVLDDGFQHQAVRRDLNIVLLDAFRPFGNGHLLPAGTLREFPPALERADLFVLTRSEGSEIPRLPVSRPLLRCRHALSVEALPLSGQPAALSSLKGRRGVAFAGIADPEGFFSSLTAQGLTLVEMLPLPDHVTYDASTVERIVAAAQGADFLVTTEKDGVKLHAGDFPLPCYQVPMGLAFFDDGERQLKLALEALFDKELR